GTPAAQTQQTAMLQYLPMIFLVFFWNFPSGLVLYWLMNNIFTIIQTVIVNKLSHSGK
ncbi:MAG TPA: membrane protein insertase YidC, partial [Firmicutes bacterium]|nr:membrane protein insertase YidC [Bacillota bacterium]